MPQHNWAGGRDPLRCRPHAVLEDAIVLGVLAVTYLTGLWLLFVGTLNILAVRMVLSVLHRWKRLPEQLGRSATSHRDIDRLSMSGEEMVVAELVALAECDPRALRIAERRVRAREGDMAFRALALERLRAARQRLGDAPRTGRDRRHLLATTWRSLGVGWPVVLSAAALVLVVFSEGTAGPVLMEPWRWSLALVAGALVGAACGRLSQRAR